MTHSREEYRKYITSDAWKQKRKTYFESNMYKTYAEGREAGKFVCWCCAKDDNSLQLHHRTYKRFGNENISVDLVPVCQECHSNIHKLEKEQGFNIWAATKHYRKVVRRLKKKGKFHK